MKNNQLTLAIIIAVISCYIVSCKQDTVPTANPTATVLVLPSTIYNYNSPTGQNDNVVTLGRVLFYDSHLSTNNSIACASCHKQASAFSDNSAFSSGFESRMTARNTPPIQNLGQSSNFNPPSLFWDGREKMLTNMVLKPITSHVEMGMNDLNSIVSKVTAMPYYSILFNKAFGNNVIDINKIATALSAFTGSIQAKNTKFDLAMNNKTTLSGLEEQGRQLFFSKYNCNSCHQTEELNCYRCGGGSPTDPGFINIGLEMNYFDIGRAGVTKNEADNGKFKIPNLRNVTLTGPYMHDGRFKTLDEVLEHYSHGIVTHPNLDIRLIGSNNMAKQMNISAQEKTAIIAFLGTLTDETMITDPKFSNPFKVQ